MPVTAEIRENVISRSWSGPDPAIAVIVSTHNRAELLDGLLDALEDQTAPDAEVVVVDNGSVDDTWARLAQRSASTALRFRAIRVAAHGGPGIPRNTAISVSRAALLAFTDDDCRPEPGWLAAIAARFADRETVLVQGRTLPDDGWAGPWARTVQITSASGLYETANLAVRRAAFDTVGGFGPGRLSGRAFGEDVILGAAIARLGRVQFAAEAVIRHRLMPATYRDVLIERWRLRAFPALLDEVPELRGRTVGAVFLSARTATTDLGVVGLATSLVTQRRWPLFAAGPWLVRAWQESAERPGRPRAFRVLQLLMADLVGLGALGTGSFRSDRMLL